MVQDLPLVAVLPLRKSSVHFTVHHLLAGCNGDWASPRNHILHRMELAVLVSKAEKFALLWQFSVPLVLLFDCDANLPGNRNGCRADSRCLCSRPTLLLLYTLLRQAQHRWLPNQALTAFWRL